LIVAIALAAACGAKENTASCSGPCGSGYVYCAGADIWVKDASLCPSMGGAGSAQPGGPELGGAGQPSPITEVDAQPGGSAGAAGHSDRGSGGSAGAGGTSSPIQDGGSAGGVEFRDAGRDVLLGAAIDANMATDVGRLGGAACGGIGYPAAGFYGENFLVPTYLTVNQASSMEMAAKLAVGASLRVKLTRISGAIWWISGQGSDWRFTQYDFATGEQMFEAPDTSRTDETTFTFPDSGKVLVEYFECGSSTPTGSKVLSWTGGKPSPFPI
jgi:hypothetical protein